MAKILSIDDFPAYAEMMGEFLRREGGHEVRVEISPVPVKEVVEFQPDLVIVAIVRKLETIGHGKLHDFYSEVDGARALRDLQNIEQANKPPIILTALGVKQVEIPPEISYMAFVHVPHELDRLLAVISQVERAKKSGSDLLSD